MVPGAALSYPFGIISIMNRIVISPSNLTSNEGTRNRHDDRVDVLLELDALHLFDARTELRL
jgi:hypothetical protein